MNNNWFWENKPKWSELEEPAIEGFTVWREQAGVDWRKPATGGDTIWGLSAGVARESSSAPLPARLFHTPAHPLSRPHGSRSPTSVVRSLRSFPSNSRERDEHDLIPNGNGRSCGMVARRRGWKGLVLFRTWAPRPPLLFKTGIITGRH